LGGLFNTRECGEEKGELFTEFMKFDFSFGGGGFVGLLGVLSVTWPRSGLVFEKGCFRRFVAGSRDVLVEFGHGAVACMTMGAVGDGGEAVREAIKLVFYSIGFQYRCHD
jgi:hypothetical protein